MIKSPKVIATGAHGCIVSPSLLCKEGSLHKEFFENTYEENTVSKIFREKSTWNDEITDSLKIRKITDYEKYFIVPSQGCEVDETEVGIWKSCEKLIGKKPEDEKNLYQLIMRDGGVSLNDYLIKTDSIEIKDWLEILLKVFKCLKVLAENKLVHMDAKLENIVYDETTKTVRIIDFGLTSSFNEVYKSVYKTPYLYWPIEFKIYEHCVDNNTCDINSIKENFITMFKKDNIQKLFSNHKVDEKININNEFLSYSNLAKIDIYSVGVSCIIMSRSMRIRGDDSSINAYTMLLANMCKFDCVNRISIDDAITEAEKILRYKTRQSKRSKIQ
jgi:serine/threonine protein kinase